MFKVMEKENLIKKLNNTVCDKKDLGLYYNHKMEEFMVFNKEEILEQFSNFSQMKDIKVLATNNKEYDLGDIKIEGKDKIYTLTISQNKYKGVDGLSFIFGTIISGYTYGFWIEENRNRLFNYLKLKV